MTFWVDWSSCFCLYFKIVMDFKHPDGVTVPVMLPCRSLLVMTGESRYLWTHGYVLRWPRWQDTFCLVGVSFFSEPLEPCLRLAHWGLHMSWLPQGHLWLFKKTLYFEKISNLKKNCKHNMVNSLHLSHRFTNCEYSAVCFHCCQNLVSMSTDAAQKYEERVWKK